MTSDDDSPTHAEPGVARRRATERQSRTRYQLGEPIGHGGMGEVLTARDLQIGREVAVKRMLAENPTERGVERFLREARIQGRLEHPAIVPVHEIGHDVDGNPFFVMKKLSGTTLSKILETPAATTREKMLRAFADACLAVAFAHTHGVVHRDLKPANIVLGDFGEVYILDWGVAKLVGDPADSIDPSADDTATGAGQSIGTPGYMAPEQVADASDVDGRADVYALGCVLFEILTGDTLHPRGKQGLSSAVAGADARASVRAPDKAIPPELDDLCVHATAHSRDKRLGSARELADAVLRYLDGDRDLARRRELASTHLTAAREAFAAGRDEDSHRTAIREAGRALALDPTLDGAAELVGRMMLEAPRTLPREVERELAADATATDRRQARTSLWISSLYLFFVPFVFVAGNWLYAGVLTTFLLLNLVLVYRRAHHGTGQHPHVQTLRNVVLVALVGHAYSPFLVGPGLAAATAASLLVTASYLETRRMWAMLAMMLAAVFVPWILEASGLVDATMTVSPTGVKFETPAIDAMGRGMAQSGFVFFTLGVVGAVAILVHVMVKRERESRRHLYVQAWQLRQLVS
jgi:eukaryotic-like serine/threonine-protein kinase